MGLLGAYGHSWVFGAGASRPENGFAARAAAGLGLGLDNRAQSATVSAENAAALRCSPPPPAALFVLMAGLNDARLHGRSAPERQDYAANIDTMLRALGPVPVVVLAQPHLVDYSGYPPFDQGSDSSVDAYNAAVEDVVSRHDFACVARVAGWDPQSMIADDGVHPNDSGHEQLAGTVIRAVGDGGFAKFLP